MADTVNGQMTDASVQGGSLSIGQAPSAAMGLTYMTMADTIGMVMHNATVAQQGMQVITNAAVTQTCLLILSKGVPSNG